MTYEGRRLVGQVPSEIEQWAFDRHRSHGYELR